MEFPQSRLFPIRQVLIFGKVQLFFSFDSNFSFFFFIIKIRDVFIQFRLYYLLVFNFFLVSENFRSQVIFFFHLEEFILYSFHGIFFI